MSLIRPPSAPPVHGRGADFGVVGGRDAGGDGAAGRKTTALAVPSILDAPGAVVATSNKNDLWAATSQLRAQQTGERVWVFDPQQIVYADRTWWWNPLRGVTTVEEAHRLAGHFVQEVRPERGDRDFWSTAALDLLTGLLLAAGSSGRDLVEV